LSYLVYFSQYEKKNPLHIVLLSFTVKDGWGGQDVAVVLSSLMSF